jgi:hypothetical protein
MTHAHDISTHCDAVVSSRANRLILAALDDDDVGDLAASVAVLRHLAWVAMHKMGGRKQPEQCARWLTDIIGFCLDQAET